MGFSALSKIEQDKVIFQTALLYRENLIYIHKNIKIFKCKFKNTSFHLKIDTNKESFTFTEEFFSLDPNQKKIDLKTWGKEDFKEDFKLKKDINMIFFGYCWKNLGYPTGRDIDIKTNPQKDVFYPCCGENLWPLLKIIFSIPLYGRPRKYFENSFGKVLISTKTEKLTGFYKKIGNTEL